MIYVHNAMANSANFTTSWGTEGSAAVLGDVVSSKRYLDRRRELQTRLEEAFRWVDRQVPADQPFQATIGDEFQGVYRDVADALRASLLIRLFLRGYADVRFGVGWGWIAMRADGSPFSQDGPAWWSAREAIEAVAIESSRRGGSKGRRTMFVAHHESEPPCLEVLRKIQEHQRAGWSLNRSFFAPDPDGLINAFLSCRDELVSGMDERDARILLLAMEGRSHEQIAESEGITQPAVSQRISKSGGYAILAAEAAIGEATEWYR